jgi:hypothetical protein
MLVKMSNKAVVFTVNGQPLFFDPHGRGGVIDTHTYCPPRHLTHCEPSFLQGLYRIQRRGEEYL